MASWETGVAAAKPQGLEGKGDTWRGLGGGSPLRSQARCWVGCRKEESRAEGSIPIKGDPQVWAVRPSPG